MSTPNIHKVAQIASNKGWDFEQLKYSDYLYGNEFMADDVWDLVDERKSIGSLAFDAKYAEQLK